MSKRRRQRTKQGPIGKNGDKLGHAWSWFFGRGTVRRRRKERWLLSHRWTETKLLHRNRISSYIAIPRTQTKRIGFIAHHCRRRRLRWWLAGLWRDSFILFKVSFSVYPPFGSDTHSCWKIWWFELEEDPVESHSQVNGINYRTGNEWSVYDTEGFVQQRCIGFYGHLKKIRLDYFSDNWKNNRMITNRMILVGLYMSMFANP